MTTEFEVKLKVLQLPEETPLLSAGVVGLVLHIHTAKEEVEIKKRPVSEGELHIIQ